MIDYENEYEEYQKRIRTIITDRIRDYYNAQKSANWSFGVTHEEIRNYLTKNLLPKIFLVSNIDLRELRRLFDLRTSLFGKNNVNLIFERKIIPKFNSLPKIDYPKNYHIKKLLIQIILVNVINDIDRLLQNNCKLFELHYDNQDYTNFEIVQYNDLLERTSIYKNLLKKYRPEEYKSMYSIQERQDDIELDIKKPSLPLAVAMLEEIGFFELPKIKVLPSKEQAIIVGIIQIVDVKDVNKLRSIIGNIKVLNHTENKEDGFKYTSHKHAEKIKEIYNKIKKGNS